MASKKTETNPEFATALKAWGPLGKAKREHEQAVKEIAEQEQAHLQTMFKIQGNVPFNLDMGDGTCLYRLVATYVKDANDKATDELKSVQLRKVPQPEAQGSYKL